jgi:cyclic beta-1,2-glucan synthetase
MGYSIYEHNSYGFEQSLRIFIDPDDAVKFATLTLKNNLDRVQQITVTYYAEWVLGPDQSRMAPFIVPEFEPQGNALLARNEYNQEFKGRIAFLAASREIHGFTTDRFEFLGQNGSYTSPAALRRLGLSGIVKPGTDPCAALQALLWLEPGETKEITFMLGQGKDYTETLQWIQKYKKIEAITESWLRAAERWTAILNRIEIQTPDPAMDLMLNQWLLYQTVSCRLWGRSALYQSGGAFGFRDQLQDVMALTQTAPHLTRSHILQAAQHQFEEGDVLHWWHPPSGRGIRSRCSDNLLWLPYVTVHYINTTGDESILEENIPFLSGKPLEDGELDRYDFYKSGEVTGTLLEHCRRAIAFGTTEGMHGLPLIGSHDWNDSLNRVGIKGKGESIWLGWFLYANLMDFSALCERIGDSAQAEAYQRQAEKFRQALDQHAWDGAWYRRAYWDDGTPIGSAENVECRIDSIAQSWAVLSNAADPQRARQAMQSIEENLVKWDEALVQLFTPPFDKSPLDPGYVKGYPPGIRENGGQYTHAALWAVWAFASLGQAELAGRLFKMLNPISHSDQYEKANRYQVEPYVVAADIYSVEPHTGKGGWTWYTGSAGWMYRLGLEVILGIKRSGAQLQISPCIPPEWPGFAVKYRYGETLYQVQVHTSQQANRRADEIRLDGEKIPGNSIPLVDDRRTHQVEVYLGK